MRPRRLLIGLVVVSLLLTSGAPGIMTVLRATVGADALNATSTLALPGWLDDLTQARVIAYPAHAVLGTVFEALDLSPAATAVQWLKAAWHASSDAEVERTARGMAAALARDTTDRRTLRTLCNLKEVGNPDQIRAVEQARIPCEQWTPNVALTAMATPLQASAGSVVSLTASVTSATTVTGLVDIEIHNADGEKVAQWVAADQQLIAQQRRIYLVSWEIPPDLPPGVYTVKLGVFQRGWTMLHGWKSSAATITIIE